MTFAVGRLICNSLATFVRASPSSKTILISLSRFWIDLTLPLWKFLNSVFCGCLSPLFPSLYFNYIRHAFDSIKASKILCYLLDCFNLTKTTKVSERTGRLWPEETPWLTLWRCLNWEWLYLMGFCLILEGQRRRECIYLKAEDVRRLKFHEKKKDWPECWHLSRRNIRNIKNDLDMCFRDILAWFLGSYDITLSWCGVISG